jgi:hypothetical protein
MKLEKVVIFRTPKHVIFVKRAKFRILASNSRLMCVVLIRSRPIEMNEVEINVDHL